MEPSIDSEGVIQYLQHLVESYEDLVEDMSKTLNKNHEELKLIEKDSRGNIPPGELRTGGGDSCPECGHSQRIIDNLNNQIQNLQKAKRLTTALWHSSAEQIEMLESRLKSTTTKASHHLSSSLNTSTTATTLALETSSQNQIKLLQNYVTSLEARLEQASQEKNFYRRKLMESKLEAEESHKRWAEERRKEVELVKASYSTEIQHLKQTLGKERQMYQSSIQKKIEDERSSWSREEQERTEALKTKWLLQVQPLIAEQEAFLLRESQLCDRLHQTQMELYHLKALLSQQQQQQPPKTADLPSPREKASTYSPRTIEADQQQPLRTCQHEACVQYSMHQRVLQENEQLAEEMSKLRKSNQSLQLEHVQNAQRLELRINSLETLNAKLQESLLHLNDPSASRGMMEQSNRTTKGRTYNNPTMTISSSSGNRSRRGSESSATTQRRDQKQTQNDHNNDPIISLAEEFTQACNLSPESYKDPAKRSEMEARIQHLERYARELQFQHKLDKRRLYLQEQSLKVRLSSEK